MSGTSIGAGAPASGSSFKLKPVVKVKTLDSSGVDDTLNRVLEAIKQLNNSSASNLSFVDLYRYAYNLVLNKHGELLYNGVSDTIMEHLIGVRDKVKSAPDDMLLMRLREAWERHTLNMKKIQDILLYMDRTYVIPNRKPATYVQGVIIFREVIMRHADIKDRVQRILLAYMKRCRQASAHDSTVMEASGSLMNDVLLRSILSMFVELGVSSNSVYVDDFETPMLAETAQFYQDESNEIVTRSTCSDYLKYAERRLEEESQRCQYLMTPPGKLLSVVERKLLGDHLLTLVNMEGSGLLFQLEHDKFDTLHRMFSLIQRLKTPIPWVAPTEIVTSERDRERHALPIVIVKDMMKAKVIREGWKVVSDAELQKEPPRLVSKLLELRDKYDTIVNKGFAQDKLFMTGLKEAFEVIVNRREAGGVNVVPAYLAAYVDEAMTKEFKTLSEADINEVLDKVIVLFRSLAAKDVFEEHYKDKTAKRLLGGKVLSEDVEKLMISKLKQECGTNYTNKLEGMFADLARSAKFMEGFKADRAADIASLGINIDATVLTSSHWEGKGVVAAPVPRGIPVVVESAAELFKTYYLSKHSGRRLTWNYAKGTADILCKFCSEGGKPATYELTVSSYQLILLMAFNVKPSYTYREFSTYNIPDDELRRHLLSLTNPKLRVLNKSSVKKEISEDDVFTVNEAFTSKLYKVRVPLVSMKSAIATAHAAAAADDDEVMASVESGRKSLLDSVIVRIMKTRKHMDHNSLIAEVVRMVSNRFMPQIADIKKRIEDLMERDYLERNADNPNVYSYLA